MGPALVTGDGDMLNVFYQAEEYMRRSIHYLLKKWFQEFRLKSRQSHTFQGKSWEIILCLLCHHWALGDGFDEYSCNNCFILCYSHVGIVECKPHWIPDLGDWGSCPLGGSVKCWGTRCVVYTLHKKPPSKKGSADRESTKVTFSHKGR